MKNIEINVERLREEFKGKSAQEVIGWAISTFGNKVAIASSFGAEDVVLIDIVVRIDPKVRIFTLDTGRLPQETYNVMDEVREKYGVKVEVCFPDARRIEEIIGKHGFNLFYKSVNLRKLCCQVRKVEPLRKKLNELSAWITGLRREQSVTRIGVEKIEADTVNNGIIKLNPLADWSTEDVWDYIRKNNVPYNRLHDKNYPSIGCAHVPGR